MFGKHSRITEDDQAIFSPRQRHIQSPWVIEETNTLGLVRSDAREEDEVFLSTLEGVDWCDFDLFVE